MWLLVLVLVPPIQGFDRVTLLETLTSLQACIELRHIVLEGMSQAYPNDFTYSIECRPQSGPSKKD